MNTFKRMIWTADTHTAGQPTRTVIAGMPRLRGRDLSEKMLYMKEHYDELRTFLISEPRGAANTSLAVLTEPVADEADVGVFYCESHGYMPMCGHNTLGVATMLVETGMVAVREPVTHICLETPAGLVKVAVHVQDGVVRAATFRNAPAFVLHRDLEIEWQGRKLYADVTYGGNIYAVLRAADFGLEISTATIRQLIDIGMEIRHQIDARYDIVHPEKAYLKGIGLVQFTAPLERSDADTDALLSRNAVVYAPGEFDRSPCGTGTSGRLALLYEKGEIAPGQVLRHQSVIGTSFDARIAEVIDDASGRIAIVPEITGSAYLTGYHTFYYDPTDPRGGGFDTRTPDA